LTNTRFRITRRGLFWGTLSTLTAVFLSRFIKGSHVFSISVHQGFTDKTSTIITVLRAENLSFQYQVFSMQSLAPNVVTKVKTETQYGSSLDQLDIAGLSVGEKYTLVISEGGKPIDRREFSSLDTDMIEPKIAVFSCSADEWRVDHAAMWLSLFRTNPNLIYSLGDNVYLDGSSYGWGVLWPVTPDPARIWRRYTDMRKNLELYRQEKLTPMIAIWDDHDFGHNGAESSYEHKAYVKQVFETFFPRPAKSTQFESGPGITMCWDAFNTRFLFLDSRFYRVTENSPAAPRTHWGTEQKQWLSLRVSESKNPIWIINGSQFLGGDKLDTDSDSLANRHPEDFEWLRRQVLRASQKVTLISGDMHYSEVVRMPSNWGSGVFEITSSALHAITNAPSGSGTRLALTTENNFMIIQIHNSSSSTTGIKATCYGKSSIPLFELLLNSSESKG
jgi:alkaline phosphatase D